MFFVHLSKYKNRFIFSFHNACFDNYGDNADVEVSWSAAAFHQPEPEVDFNSGASKRSTSERRCRRRERLYGGKRRRRSPHPSTTYRLSVPHHHHHQVTNNPTPWGSLCACCVTFAESEPYCHSILFVCLSGCLSVIPRPTAYHD